ncbi:MAG: hypothetical protein ACOY4Q_13345 [Bacillota bacterium]
MLFNRKRVNLPDLQKQNTGSSCHPVPPLLYFAAENRLQRQLQQLREQKAG